MIRAQQIACITALAVLMTAIAAPARGFPNDPGDGSSRAWRNVQWYLNAPSGIGASQAWQIAMASGQPGGTGITVAILDTGVAYRDTPRRPRP